LAYPLILSGDIAECQDVKFYSSEIREHKTTFNTTLFIYIPGFMFEKKTNIIKSPDLSKLKEVVIDHRTKIYISPDADVEKARERYLSRLIRKKP
jgi:hypothetical protein